MSVARYRYVHPDVRLPSARIPHFVICDLESELPTVDVGEGDIAYAKDSDKLFKRTASEWIVIVSSSGGTGTGAHVYRFGISDPAPGNSLYPLLVSPYAGTIKKVQAIRAGSGSVAVNVELGGTDILSPDLAVGTAWTASAALTTAVAIGNTIAISLKSVVSPIGYLAVQVEFEES